MQDKLCTATLGDLGQGQARDIIDEQLNRAVADAILRGKEDGKVRKVTIQVEIELGDDGETLVARAFAQFKPPPFFAGASRGEVSEERGKPPAMLFDLSEAEEAAA